MSGAPPDQERLAATPSGNADTQPGADELPRERMDWSARLARLQRKLTQAWLPSSFDALVDETQREIRAVLTLALALFPISFVLVAHRLLVGERLTAMPLLAVLVILGLVPGLVKRTGRVELATHLSIASLFLLTSLLGWTQGGPAAHTWSLGYFVLPAMAATLLRGTRAGLWWAASGLTTMLVLASVGPEQASFDRDGSELAPLWNRALLASLLIVVVALITAQFDHVKKRLVKHLEEKTRQLDRAQTELEHQRLEAASVREEATRAQADFTRLHAEVEMSRIEAVTAHRKARLAQDEALAAKAESEMAHAEVVEVDRHKTLFFQNISHELRTPLTLVLSGLEREASDQPDNDRLAVALRNAHRMLRLINQLLDFEKLRAGKLKLELAPICMQEFVRATTRCFQPLCDSREVQLQVNLTEATPTEGPGPDSLVLAEVAALEKILFNYLSNALKFAPKGSQVTVGVLYDTERVGFSVSDQGPGINEADQEKLFKVFSQLDSSATRQHEGTGLGLALTRQLAEALNGAVGVRSAEGQGATFWLELDRYRPEAAEQVQVLSMDGFQPRTWLMNDGEEQHRTLPPVDPHQADGSLADATGGRILVVDDLADMRNLIAGTLVDLGYRVQLAEGAASALRIARKHPPDLIICDWMMPGMSGIDLLEKMGEDTELKHIPVILLTAKNEAEARVKASLAGAASFLAKPFDSAELGAEVRNLLALKSREREVETLNRKLVEQGVARCLPPALLEGVLSGKLEFTQVPKLQSLAVLSARLDGFENQLRTLAPRRSGRLLDDYLGVTSRMAFAYQGTLTHFSCDRIDVLFGAPEPMPPAQALYTALTCAMDMHEVVSELSEAWNKEGLSRPGLCVGVHAGEALVGTFGSELRSEYTAIGPAVALAQKLAQVASPHSVTICQETGERLPPGSTRSAGRLVLQGESDALQLVRLSKNARKLLSLETLESTG